MIIKKDNLKGQRNGNTSFKKTCTKGRFCISFWFDYHKEVEIIAMESEGLPDEIQHWLKDIRLHHPFAKMSKEEILKELRKTREIVWQERYAD